MSSSKALFGWQTRSTFAWVLLFGSISSLHGQTVSGTILGTVADQQGAILAGVEVTARNAETGAVRRAATEGTGAYRITSVPAGTYEVSISASGFKTEVKTGVVVTVGGDSTANFSMSIGAAPVCLESFSPALLTTAGMCR